jgi:GNAT superfamily N-acetyltransferase
VASSERSPDLTIREYKDGDQAGFEQLVTSVHREFGFEYDPALDADLNDPPAFYVKTWVLMEADGSIGGSVALRDLRNGVELKRMYLKPQLRRQGYGHALLETALTWAREAAYGYVDLDTAEHLTGAQKFYARAGFVITGHSDNEDGPRMLYYHLELEPRSS